MSKINTSSDEVTLESDVPDGGKLEGVQHTDANVVDWGGPTDAGNPHNWSSGKRWGHVILVALLGLVTNMASTMCAPGIDGLVDDFNISSSTVSTLAITLYVLGSALSQNLAQFMVFRFISGCAGGTPMALRGGTIADVTSPEKRATAMSLFSLGPLTGPVLGPLIGGFVAAAKGWRWIFWILAILAGALEAATLVVMRETQPRVLLERKAKRLRASSGNQNLASKLAHTQPASQLLVQALVRPIMLLLHSPILLVISLYVALVFGLLYILLTTFSPVFEVQYGFTTSTSGLVYLGLGVALVVDVFLFSAILKAKDLQRPLPEHRLVLMIWLSPFVAVGAFIYGWTVYYNVHWIVPIIGTAFIGLGSFFVVMPAQLYIVDLFGSEAAASALSANLLLRYVSGTFLPLAAPRMYKAMGYGWGNTLLGFLALSFVPAPVLFYKYGERLRSKTAIGAS